MSTVSMGKVIVIQFVTLDGVVEDPDGRGGTPFGGWAFRFGAEAIAGDKFRLGSLMTTGALLFGRRTWEHFSRLWPTRTDPFSTAMNAIPKYVLTRGTPQFSAWSNSHPLEGELLDGVARLAEQTDVIAIGSTSVVRALAAADAVDEYRLLTAPTFVGTGQRLFDHGNPVELDVTSVVSAGPMTLSTYEPSRPSRPAVSDALEDDHRDLA